MTIDVVCAGAPFLDLVFRGLDRIPAAGEEVLARDLTIVPGAMANVAYALRRLGLDAVVCAPIGTDPAGRFLKELMDDAGTPWLGNSAPATPVSVGLPLDGERAFVTSLPPSVIDVDAIARIGPRAVVINLPLPAGMPDGPRVYGVVGDPEVAVLLDRPPDSWTDLRAVVLNEREAFHLSGRAGPTDAARHLAARGCLVIVTRGPGGAVAATPAGHIVEAPGLAVVAADTVGAGDLFTAAFVWADLAERPLEEGLAVATAYAGHSLAAAGSGQKGLDRAAFLDAIRPTSEPGSWMLEAPQMTL